MCIGCGDCDVLKADYLKVWSARANVRRWVSDETKGQDDLMKKLVHDAEAVHIQSVEAQMKRDNHHKRAMYYFRKGKEEKARDITKRRNSAGNQAKLFRERRDELHRQVREAKREIEIVSGRFGLPQLKRDFAIARLLLLRHLAENESPEEVTAKLEYSQFARVPVVYSANLSRIWMYQPQHRPGDSEIHLFYGGGYAPIGNGHSPDGWKHGHHVILTKPSGQMVLEFARLPGGEILDTLRTN